MALNFPLRVQDIIAEAEFKWICDGLLYLEVGPTLQTLAAPGSDGGVDAEFVGSFGGTSGRWVFQYKYVSPATDPNVARSRIKSNYIREEPPKRASRPATGSKKSTAKVGEFEKPRVRDCCGYVLLTNVEVTSGLVHDLREKFQDLHGNKPFCVWDPARLNHLLAQHPQLARSHSEALHEECLEAVVQPAWKGLNAVLLVARAWSNTPLWPICIETVQHSTLTFSFEKPYSDPIFVRRLACQPTALQLRSMPLFAYAAGTAFPNSFRHWTALEDSLKAVVAAHREWVASLAAEIRDPSRWFSTLNDDARTQASEILAFTALVTVQMNRGWFYSLPSSTKRIDSTCQGAEGIVYEGERRDEVAQAIKVMLKDLQPRPLPNEVVSARQQLAKALNQVYPCLWYAAVLEMDAPKPPPPEEVDDNLDP